MDRTGEGRPAFSLSVVDSESSFETGGVGAAPNDPGSDSSARRTPRLRPPGAARWTWERCRLEDERFGRSLRERTAQIQRERRQRHPGLVKPGNGNDEGGGSDERDE